MTRHNIFLINRNSILYVLFLFLPFFNILSHRINDFALIIIILPLVFLSFVNFDSNKKYSMKISYILLIILLLFNFYIIYQYNVNNGNTEILYYLKFFGSFIFIFFYFVMFFNLEYFIINYYIKLIKYFVIIISISIIIDYIILHSYLDISLQLMYSSEAYSYKTRPFGIFGQPSVNSTLLVFFYFLLLAHKDKINYKVLKNLFLLVTISIVLQGSGSGFVSFAVLILALLFNSKYKYYALFFIFLILLIVINNIIEKISLEYMVVLLEHSNTLITQWFDNIKSPLDLLFGGIHGGIDFGPLFITSEVGLIYFILLTLLFLYMISRANFFEKYAIIILLIGNLHYPVIFYVIMQFFLPVYMYKIFNNKAVR